MSAPVRMPVVWSLPLDARPPGEPLQQWLYEALRQAIVSRRILPNSRMPSSRRLASQYRMARGTVQAAYGRLIAEGYLVSSAGSHTRVCATLPELQTSIAVAAQHTAEPIADRPVAGAWLARLAEAEPAFPMSTSLDAPRAFAPHRCDTRSFPIDTWRAMHLRLLRPSRMAELTDADPRGARPLRQAIAEYLRTARGVVAGEDEIVVVSSVQQAFDICLRILTRPDDAVWMENPGYPGARQLAMAAGVRVVDVGVDGDGMRVDDAIARVPDARLAYVTPSRHAPMGVPLSVPRCQALLEWAHDYRSFLFEDSYDSDYRFKEQPGPSLKRMLGGASSVILAGTFSKLLLPALRIAYVALPPQLVEPFTRAMSLMARHPNTLSQLALAHFMMEGHLDRHIRRTQRLYAARAEAFVHHGRRRWQGVIDVPDIHAGLDVAVRLGQGTDEPGTVRLLRDAGIDVAPLARYAAPGSGLPAGLLMGFAPFTEDEIARGAVKVARAISPRIKDSRASAAPYPAP